MAQEGLKVIQHSIKENEAQPGQDTGLHYFGIYYVFPVTFGIYVYSFEALLNRAKKAKYVFGDTSAGT